MFIMKGDQLLQKEKQNHLICCKANILNISFLHGKHDGPTLPGEGECGRLKKLGSYMALSVSFIYNALS